MSETVEMSLVEKGQIKGLTDIITLLLYEIFTLAELESFSKRISAMVLAEQEEIERLLATGTGPGRTEASLKEGVKRILVLIHTRIQSRLDESVHGLTQS